MFKKIIAVLLVFGLIGVGAWKVFFSGDKIADKAEDVITNLQSYYLEANMDMNKGEEQRKFDVKVSYKKDGDKDYFRVSLKDTMINQEQLMLRNDEGVFVLTPALNQVYQFKSDWPLNSAKPYIYQSLLDVFKGEYSTKKLSDGTVVTSEPNYRNSPQYKKQEIKFSKDLKPVWVHLYGENDEVLVKVTFTKVDTAPSFDAEHFNLSPNMIQAREDMSNDVNVPIDELPLFPAGSDLVGIELKENTKSVINGEEMFILTYEGESSFTIVQRVAEIYDDMQVELVNGELIDLIGGVGVFDKNRLMYTYNGVEYQIYGDDLGLEMFIEIANAMQVVAMK